MCGILGFGGWWFLGACYLVRGVFDFAVVSFWWVLVRYRFVVPGFYVVLVDGFVLVGL